MLQRLKKEMHELRNPAGHEFFARADHLLERNRSGLRPTVAEQWLAQLVPASEKGVRERERAFGWIWETSLLVQCCGEVMLMMEQTIGAKLRRRQSRPRRRPSCLNSQVQ